MGLANRRAREDSDAAQTSQDFVVDVTSVPSVRSSSQISPPPPPITPSSFSPQGVLGLATEGDRSEDIVQRAEHDHPLALLAPFSLQRFVVDAVPDQ